MSEVLKNISVYNVVWSLVFIVAAFVLSGVINKFSEKLLGMADKSKEDVIKKKAAVKRFAGILKLIVFTLALLAVLQINGINVSSLVAGLGIFGALMALAVQDLCKDVIQGFRIVTDNYFSVGDCIRYNGEDYQVIEFSIRTTRMKSIEYKNEVTVSNRNITEVTKLSGLEILKIPLSYDEDVEKVDTVLGSSAEEIDKVKGISKCKYLGLSSFEESAIRYIITFNCRPSERFTMRRAAMRIIKKNLDEAGLKIPYNQLDIHAKQ